MTPPDVRSRLAAESLAATSWSNGPGDRYASHRHDYDKVLVAARGSIVFMLPEAALEVQLDEGDRLDLPAGTLHGAVVGPAGVECLEAHLPAGRLAPEPRHVQGWAETPDAGQTDGRRTA